MVADMLKAMVVSGVEGRVVVGMLEGMLDEVGNVLEMKTMPQAIIRGCKKIT